MSYIDDLEQAASEALAASSSATDSAQIMSDVANGDENTTVTTANGEVKTLAKAIKDIIDSIEAGVEAPQVEPQTLSAGQTTVSLTTMTTEGIAVYVEGSREFDFNVVNSTDFDFSQSFPDGTRIWVVKRDIEGVADSFTINTATGSQTLSNALDQRVIYVDTLTDLQALPTGGLVDGQGLKITTTGRAGDFVVRVGDFSTEVTNDPQNGIWIPFDDDPTGASIVAMRLYNRFDYVPPEWWGALGDEGGNVDTIPLRAALATGLNVGLQDKRYLSDTLRLKAKQKLIGRGIWKTELRCIGAVAAGDFIALEDPDVFAVNISGFTIHGNKSNQTNPVNGLVVDNDGETGIPQADAKHVITDMYILECSGDSFILGKETRGSTVKGVYIKTGSQVGFRIQSTDSYIEDVVAGACNIGIISEGANNRHVGLKAYGCADDGIRMDGQRDHFSVCEAQDNAGAGFEVVGGDRSIKANILLADSNGGVGLFLNGSVGAEITGLTSVSRVGGQFTQTFGINFGTSSDCSVSGSVSGNTGTITGNDSGNTYHIYDGTGRPYRSADNIAAQYGFGTEVAIGNFGGLASIRLGEDSLIQRESVNTIAIDKNLRIQGASKILSGTGAPGAIGQDGDLYIRQDGSGGSFLYGKFAGTWTAIA